MFNINLSEQTHHRLSQIVRTSLVVLDQATATFKEDSNLSAVLPDYDEVFGATANPLKNLKLHPGDNFLTDDDFNVLARAFVILDMGVELAADRGFPEKKVKAVYRDAIMLIDEIFVQQLGRADVAVQIVRDWDNFARRYAAGMDPLEREAFGLDNN